MGYQSCMGGSMEFEGRGNKTMVSYHSKLPTKPHILRLEEDGDVRCDHKPPYKVFQP